MFQYRKVLEMKSESFSLRSIRAATGHSRQKITEVIKLAEKKEVTLPLTDEMRDKWLEEFLYPVIISCFQDLLFEVLSLTISNRSPSVHALSPLNSHAV